jgi:hypothetical protein
VVVGLHESHRETNETGRYENGPSDIETTSVRIARLTDEEEREEDAEHPERHIDPEHRGPVEGREQEATDNGPCAEPQPGDPGPQANRERTALGRERVDEDRERERGEQRRTDACSARNAMSWYTLVGSAQAAENAVKMTNPSTK